MASPALILHGGAGIQDPNLREARYRGLRHAFEAAWTILSRDGSALDAVVQAVVCAGKRSGFQCWDRCVSQRRGQGRTRCFVNGRGHLSGWGGGRSPYCAQSYPAGEGRDGIPAVRCSSSAKERSVLPRPRDFRWLRQEELITARQRQRWLAAQDKEDPGTVGAVALDKAGHLAAATSTGGLSNKQPGRVGDSAVIGAGTYADDGLGAGSATGIGEAIIRATLTKTAVDLLRGGRDPMHAARAAIALLHTRAQGEGGLILLDTFGRIGYAFNTPAMSIAFFSGGTLTIRD